ncbi:hypothetical protein NBRGN_016_01190 [Nocardia brasiliensis NBRC 14402]|uniref:hypothetical protein n=1 Tax=Nocardia brasiliensis TaxID=37326 RepID=UPI0003001F0A|nr:hypothetical protein [Nocardia brasiliensis]ASF12481.1 hypothetical protein CEQ30_39780 [Nocardia brasiliensis]GAJ79734.1 hypothetical protein NBRGN_016_01190 [Nocardia brasiliensis NBRC 14402]SUB53464.1 Uncharacterised protein [Nocardia brasiliensis]
MADPAVHDLPDAARTVLRRRADAAGLQLAAYLRAELIALADRRSSDDTVVEFLESEGRDLTPEIDSAAVALVDAYDLPAATLATFGRRAHAADLPLGAYVRRALIASARRTTVDDAMLEFRELRDENPALILDLAALADSVRYARGE